MPTDRHPIPRRPIGAILEARRREKAALAARCRSFGMIAEAMAHYGRERGPTLTSADRRGRWEPLGTFAGGAAAMDTAELRAASEGLRHEPTAAPPPRDPGPLARAREPASAPAFAETRS